MWIRPYSARFRTCGISIKATQKSILLFPALSTRWWWKFSRTGRNLCSAALPPKSRFSLLLSVSLRKSWMIITPHIFPKICFVFICLRGEFLNTSTCWWRQERQRKAKCWIWWRVPTRRLSAKGKTCSYRNSGKSMGHIFQYSNWSLPERILKEK